MNHLLSECAKLSATIVRAGAQRAAAAGLSHLADAAFFFLAFLRDGRASPLVFGFEESGCGDAFTSAVSSEEV